jgi:excisionase family DNA binding protein
MEEPLLTVQEVAKLLRVDPTTIRRWIKQGSLQAISFPEKVNQRQRQTHRIRQSVVNAVLQTTFEKHIWDRQREKEL